MKPKIIFMNRVYPPVHGATGRVMRELAQGFAKDGWDVEVIASGAKAVQERDGAVSVTRVKAAAKPKDSFGYVVTLMRLFFAALALPKVKKGDAAPVFVSMTDPPMLGLVGWYMQRFKGYRHIHWCHDVYPDLFPVIGVGFPKLLQNMMVRLSRKFMVAADKVVVIGRCMGTYLREAGVPQAQVSVIPNWPDKELTRGRKAARDDFFDIAPHDGARDHGAQIKDQPKFRVLYAGNIGRAHPIDSILQAAEVLNKDHPEIEFVFVGDGPEFEKVLELRALKHLDTIRLLPYQPTHRLKALMESGDLHLVAMKDEGLGMLVPCKFYSALAVGRPSILLGPQDSEIGKVIAEYNAGDVVASNDVRGLIEVIRRYRRDPDEWFAVQSGAEKAGKVFVAKASLHAWIKRAQAVYGQEAFESKKQTKPKKKTTKKKAA